MVGIRASSLPVLAVLHSKGGAFFLVKAVVVGVAGG
jgi:hypothetical protein